MDLVRTKQFQLSRSWSGYDGTVSEACLLAEQFSEVVLVGTQHSYIE